MTHIKLVQISCEFKIHFNIITIMFLILINWFYFLFNCIETGMKHSTTIFANGKLICKNYEEHFHVIADVVYTGCGYAGWNRL